MTVVQRRALAHEGDGAGGQQFLEQKLPPMIVRPSCLEISVLAISVAALVAAAIVFVWSLANRC